MSMPLSGQPFELQPGEALIGSARPAQAVVRTFFDDAPVLHDDDPVGGTNGCKAVRNHDRGAIGHQPLERVLNQAF